MLAQGDWLPLLFSLLLLSWAIPLLGIFLRYQRLAHAHYLLTATLLWPLLLLDDVLRLFDQQGHWAFLAGAWQFLPTLMIVLLYLCLHKLLIAKPLSALFRLLLPLVVALAVNIAYLRLPMSSKLQLLHSPPDGQLLAYWPLYASYFVAAVSQLYLGLRCSQMIHDYQYHLSDQVVDTKLYHQPAAWGLFSGLITVAFGGMMLILAMALSLFYLPQWQSVINLLYAGTYWLLIMALLQRRRYSPSPLDYELMDRPQYSQKLLVNTLKKAEQAVIHYRAYKHIGLRIQQLSKLAEVEPTVLAVATQQLLNRNFRAFIYHYRLEYASKILMRTDAKVASVAKRLGFNSEKFLSGMFIKYIETMGKQDHPDEDKLF